VVGANLCESQLESVDALGGLDTEDLRSLEFHAQVVDVRKGDWLFMKGDPRSYVYCLVDGRIKISRLSPTGKEFILALIEPGEIFGESSLFMDGPHDSFGVASRDSRVVTIPSSELAKLMEKRSDLPLQLAKLVEHRRQRIERRLVTLAFHKVRGRVASLLLQLCQDYGVREIDGISLGIELRHQEMANLIGVSREIVSHTLSDFRREGLIDSDGRKLIVRQRLLEQIQDLAPHHEEVMS